jgi:hypothetical protein
MFNKIKNWIEKLLIEEYELTIWTVKEVKIMSDGSRVSKKEKAVYNLRSIEKKTMNHIIGKDANKMIFEIKTVDPFDYQIRKIK